LIKEREIVDYCLPSALFTASLSFNEHCHERIEEFILSKRAANICQNEGNNGKYIQYYMLFQVD
jgi:hypothetical protein